MQKILWGVFAMVITLAQAVGLSQSGVLKTSVDITDADVKAVLKNAPPAVDQQLRIVDLGKLNLAVGIVHRGPTKDSPDGVPSGIAHDATTETYIIVSGSGTLVTDGTITDGRRSAPDSPVTKILNGPSSSGPIKNGRSRIVKTGDIIIIPAGVPHGWTGITDHVDYLSVRPDPDKVLETGYVHPTLKKSG